MSAHQREEWAVTPLAPADCERWKALYRGYADFYDAPTPEHHLAAVWGWLQDSSHPLQGLAVSRERQRLVGFAHFREFPRPLLASTGYFLDDLFVDPHHRGSGAADALLSAVRRRAAEAGVTVVRWMTAEDNYRARRMYDQRATRTNWVVYDMEVEPIS